MGTLAALTYETLIAACGWLILAAAMVLLMRAVIGDRARGRRRCGKCWYDMAGVPGLTCPECGRVHKRERALGRSRRSRKLIALALMGAILGFSVSQVWFWKTGAFLDYVPRWALAAAAWTQAERAEKVYGMTPSQVDGLFSPLGVPRSPLLSQLRGRAAPATNPDLKSRWEGLLVCWYAGRMLDQYANAPRSDLHASDMISQASDVLALFETSDDRMGMKALRRAMWGPHWEKPIATIGAKADGGHKPAIEWLEAAVLDNRDPLRSAAAAHRLCLVASRHDRALQGLVRVVQHPLDIASASAIVEATKQGMDAQRTMEVVELLLASPHPSVREGCLAGLAQLRPTLRYEHLLWRLLHSDPSAAVRARATRSPVVTICRMDDWGPALVALCEEEEPEVANAAMSSFAQWASHEAWSTAQFAGWLRMRDESHPLSSGGKREPFEWAKSKAMAPDKEFLRARYLYRFAELDERMLKWYLRTALEHPDAAVRENALLAVPELRAPADWQIDLVAACLRIEPLESIRAVAVRSLIAIVDTHNSEIQDLIARALRDRHASVQYAAIEICGRREIVDAACIAALEELAMSSDARMAYTAQSVLDRAGQEQAQPE